MLPVGDWGDPITWEVYQGGIWIPAMVPPARINDVFVLKDHEVRLNEHAEVNNLYLFGQGEAPGKKLNLQHFDLDIYGALRSFGEDSEGEWIIHSSAHPSADWIYPEQGSLVFRGVSRTVVDRGSWSGLTSYSRYTVRFNPDPGEVLTVNAGFKANAFIIESGTVYQTVNTNGTPATSTFSFNIHDSFGTGAYGGLFVRSGARLISEASAGSGQILRRTTTRPVADFRLEEGAELVLLGERPQLEAANVQLDGRVVYRNEGTGVQRFLAKTFAESQEIRTYHALAFEGDGSKMLPPELFLSGDFLVDGGAILDGGTLLVLMGDGDQRIDWEGSQVTDLSVEKTGGLVRIAHDLEVMRDFSMLAGNFDFEGNRLLLNTSMVGSYRYEGGQWRNLAELGLSNLPETLDEINGVFPFFDGVLGAPRGLKLVATSIPSNQGLSIAYLQRAGLSYGEALVDHDGKEIVYHLNSHFVINHAGDYGGELEIWIQGDDMLLDDPADLRIAGDGVVAVGFHEESVVLGARIWARRALEFGYLADATFTLASTEPLSILPLEWAHVSATELDHGVQVVWQTQVKEGTRFRLLRAVGVGARFNDILDVGSDSLGMHGASYYFLDSLVGISGMRVFYKVIAWDEGGFASESPVFAVTLAGRGNQTAAVIFPNPYFSGQVNLIVPQHFMGGGTRMVVHDSRGKLWLDCALGDHGEVLDLATQLGELSRGVYFFHFLKEGNSQTIKWLKKY